MKQQWQHKQQRQNEATTPKTSNNDKNKQQREKQATAIQTSKSFEDLNILYLARMLIVIVFRICSYMLLSPQPIPESFTLGSTVMNQSLRYSAHVHERRSATWDPITTTNYTI